MKSTRTTRLILSCATVMTLALCARVCAAGPPNFVWIIADDMSPDTAAYGVNQVRTPHLDGLGADGRRYTRAYATAPVCSASRSAFILGCYQTTTGLHPHDVENPQPLPSPYRHLPGLLRDAGWFVSNAAAPGSKRNGKTVSKGKTHYNFTHDPEEIFDGDDWRKRKPGQPFFAQFQITEPHRPFPIPSTYDEEKLRAIELPSSYPDTPLTRRDWYAYQRSVEVVDQRVGLILDQLREEGVLENTIVMFFADHGRPMPWGKQWLSVEGLRVPLLIRGPGIAGKTVEDRLVSLIDLAPSMLKLAGLPVPAWMEGRPILGDDFPKRDAVFAARDRCGDAMDRIRAVIGLDTLFVQNFNTNSRLNWSSYKEATYPGMPLLRVLEATGRLDAFQSGWLVPNRPPVELYVLKNDAQGVHDVAKDPRYSGTLVTMQRQLEDWITSSNDRGVAGDPATEPPLDQIQREKRADYQRAWKSRIQKPEPTDAERLAWWMKSYGLE